MALWYYTMLPFIAGVSSTFASLLLLFWLQSLCESLSRKVMARQLWHLALADLFASLFLVPWFALGLLHALHPEIGEEDSIALSVLCSICHLNNLFYMVSVFVEIHIALSTIATILRRPGTMRTMSWCLPLVWIPGLITGSVVAALGQASWDPKNGECNPKNEAEQVKAAFMAAALVIYVITYIAGIWFAARQHGGSVENRAWRRARLFIFAAMVTWVPFVVFSYWPRSGSSMISSDNNFWYYIMCLFLESNGLCNALVYAWQSGFCSRTRRRALTVSPQGSQVEQTAQISYDVAFCSTVSEVDVTADTTTANNRALRGIKELRGEELGSTDVSEDSLAAHLRAPPDHFLQSFEPLDLDSAALDAF